jgi:hypothetical protein
VSNVTMIMVSETGPLNYLASIGRIDPLPTVDEQLETPPAAPNPSPNRLDHDHDSAPVSTNACHLCAANDNRWSQSWARFVSRTPKVISERRCWEAEANQQRRARGLQVRGSTVCPHELSRPHGPTTPSHAPPVPTHSSNPRVCLHGRRSGTQHVELRFTCLLIDIFQTPKKP